MLKPISSDQEAQAARLDKEVNQLYKEQTISKARVNTGATNLAMDRAELDWKHPLQPVTS